MGDIAVVWMILVRRGFWADFVFRSCVHLGPQFRLDFSIDNYRNK